MVRTSNVESRSFFFEPLTPISFLDRSAAVYAEHVAVIDGELRLTYRELLNRSLRLASLLNESGIESGDRVAVLAPNNHVLLESHYGVPLSGGVLVALNTRLADIELTHIVKHAECKVILYDERFEDVALRITQSIGAPLVGILAGEEYESRLSNGPQFRVQISNELDLIALNYTSGTTGSPKGVMYHHRGAYLQSLAMVSHFDLKSVSVYLWTLPMFHCNGWCFTWAVTAAGGTHVCLPAMDVVEAWKLIRKNSVSHLCAAPTVLAMLGASGEAALNQGQIVRVAVGGAPPAPALIEVFEKLGFQVTHLYGLTETFGPLAICDWKAEWDQLSLSERSSRRSRQGVGNVISQMLRVVGQDGNDVEPDGSTLGEIIVRGNNVMMGYFKDPEATRNAIVDGWFHTGDLAVMHEDSYVEIRDRAKDIVISGGENISSVEIESALMNHPAVLEVAVVAVQNDYWGERPIAFVTLHDGALVTENDLKEFVRRMLASFKIPDRVIFGTLPKTGTGKIQKFKLREIAKSLGD